MAEGRGCLRGRTVARKVAVDKLAGYPDTGGIGFKGSHFCRTSTGMEPDAARKSHPDPLKDDKEALSSI